MGDFFVNIFDTLSDWFSAIRGLFLKLVSFSSSMPYPLNIFLKFGFVIGIVFLLVLLVGKILNALKVW